MLPAAVSTAQSKYRKAKLWLMKKSSRSSSVINKNQLMEGSETYLQDTKRFVLSGFFSCLLRKRTEDDKDRTIHIIGNSSFFHSYALASSLSLFLHREGDKLKKLNSEDK